jgi:hypothetical protein
MNELNKGWALTSPSTIISDLLCITICFNPSTTLHFEGSVVSCLKRCLDSHLIPWNSITSDENFMYS